MKNKIIIICLLIVGAMSDGYTQGPPITGDKPIMLSGGTSLIKTLTEVRKSTQGTFTRAPLMLHHVISKNFIAAIHLPYISYNFTDGNPLGKGTAFGDVQLMMKYQFLRKDVSHTTLRAVIKTVQTFPTGKNLGLEGFSFNEYQSYQGVVVGYEAGKYGLSSEIGYQIIPNSNRDFLTYRVGFGLPLLKQVYPVNQLNLYFEYHNNWYTDVKEYELHYAQGIQYARDQITIELAVLIPLVQDIIFKEQRDYSLLFGTRFVF